MSNISIGITAMELFAYNPFRILGIPVNATHSEIENTYKKLNALADSGEIGNYKSPYDFDSLPPFSRSAQTVKTAYAKLASTGYRCFAYADSDFSASLNIDDILLNLRDIGCYDCFLRCYMWLIINDRDMQEHDLWIQLAAYIDKLIMSSPDEWTRYFDSRFPDEMVDERLSVYKSFYGTFCEIILLPLKEMVRGSMKCHTASEILQCAGIDINEEFEFIDIPQANAPKPGEPAPKLKLALKYGDEYFDIKTGTMRSYSADTEAAESNSFAAASAAPLDADMIISDEPEVSEQQISAEQADEEFLQQNSYAEEPVYESEPVYEEEPESAYAPAPEPVQQAPQATKAETVKLSPADAPQPASHAPIKSRAERRAERIAQTAQEEIKVPRPTQLIAPKPAPLKIDNDTAPSPAPVATPAPTAPAAPKPRRSKRSMSHSAASSTSEPAKQNSAADFSSSNPFFSLGNSSAPTKQESQPNRAARGYTKVVEEAAKKEAEAAAAEAVAYDEEDDENLYTNALIEMLRSSQSRGETMKSVDTKHMAKQSDLAAPSHTEASMDAINMDKYDEKKLASPYEMSAKKLTREERYRNVKIDDMLGTNSVGKNYAGLSAVEEYKKKKETEKANRRSILLMTGVIALCLVIFAAMFLGGFI